MKLIDALEQEQESYWSNRGERKALRLFRLMAKRVPAYKDFLKKHHIHPESVKTIEDFSNIPPISKDTYLRAYPRTATCWDGTLANKPWIIATTSGSTGEPFYFPRTQKQNMQYAVTAELYLRTNFEIHKRKTLYIVGFPMGAWIGGVFTLQALEILQKKGYPISIITPGINKREILNAVKNIGGDFEQILIGSYGPFLKDILDEGVRMGLSWGAYRLGFIFSAEGFSETFRDYVIETCKLVNPYTATLNHYGTVDMGTMSYETPLAILIRRLGMVTPDLYTKIFADSNKLPTLTQYIPEHFYFESQAGNIYCTADSGIPLVRYDLKDHGGVISFGQMTGILDDLDIDVEQVSRRANIYRSVWPLPFVYVYERSDFSVSFFAFQIYPETIRKALQQKQFEQSITGKFTMMVTFDTHANQQLEIHIEKKPDSAVSPGLKKRITHSIIDVLVKENSEYRKTREEYPAQTTPLLTFWPYEHPTYFSGKGKQQWVKK